MKASVLQHSLSLGSPTGLVVKNPPANAGDARDVSSVPMWGRSLEKEMAIHSRILAWEIPWTEESGSYNLRGHKGVRHDLVSD